MASPVSLRRICRLLAPAVFAAVSVGLASAQPLPLPPEEAAPQEAAPDASAPPGAPAPGAVPAPGTPSPAELPPEESDKLPPSDAKPLPSSSAAAKPPAAPRRTLHTAAVIQVLDKVTAENLRFEAPLHKFIRYKGLIFLVNTCQGGADDQPPSAHLEIDSQPPQAPGRPANPVKLVFRGWMFADMPGPHPFEHPVYDAWLIACKTAAPGA